MGEKKEVTKKLSLGIGTDPINWFRILSKGTIDKGYYFRTFVVTLICLFSVPFQLIERLVYNRRVKNLELKDDPVFILGHWRSGTTFMHNLITRDQQMGYVSTYHSMFPEYLASSWLYKPFMKWKMPKKRLFDNMKQEPDLPLEEEVGIVNTSPVSFFLAWYFPRNMLSLFRRYVLFDGITEKEMNWYQKALIRIMKKTVLYTGNSRLVLKNPSNTGRIQTLLKLFPNAKFIYLYRNPLDIYPSTFRLYSESVPIVGLQDYNEPMLKKNILIIYKELILKYQRDKHLIPKENLLEFRYEDLVNEPIEALKDIYNQFNIPGFEQAEPEFNAFLDSRKGYKKNTYQYPEEMIKLVSKEWKFAFELMDYPLPELEKKPVKSKTT